MLDHPGRLSAHANSFRRPYPPLVSDKIGFGRLTRFWVVLRDTLVYSWGTRYMVRLDSIVLLTVKRVAWTRLLA